MEIKGIDVSKYQGEIDGEQVAASGVQFAFIRVGWAGYEGGIDEGFDPCFDRNMAGAIAAGIPVGAYVYSYCKSADAARRAAREAAAKCAPYQLSWPLVLDIEDAATYKGFSKRDIENATQPFYKEKENGNDGHLGLGLHISEILCHRHGGFIRVYNGQHGGCVTAVFRF